MDELTDLPLDSLRRLARGLLFDRAQADDVVQEAWLAALRRQPEPARMSGWLAEAVRRIARSTGRAEQRRSAREQRVARPEALPSAAESTARIEVLRTLLDAVDSLDEPYRTAIVLRYFDELPPRAIAQRLGVPVNTARTQVRRGLERLRRQLDGERGEGREGLLAALAPFAGRPPWRAGRLAPASPALSLPWIGGVLVMKKTVGIAAALALVAGAFWLRGRGPREDAPAHEVSALAEAALRPAAAPQDEPPARAAAAGEREPEGRVPVDAAASWVVRGSVHRSRGAPHPGARLLGRVFAGTRPEGTPLVDERFVADEHGDFAWSLPPPSGTVTVYVEPVREGQLGYALWDVFLPGDAPPFGWQLRASPYDGVLRGTVRDSDGRAVAGARVVHERGVEMSDVREVRTDAEGRFALSVASMAHVSLMVIAPGFGIAQASPERVVPGEQTLDIVLGPEKRMRGRVVDQAGAPVEGALVSATIPLELAAATTDADGRFDLGGFGENDPRRDDWGGSMVTVWAARSGFATVNKSVQRSELGAEQLLELKRGVFVSGRVLDSDRTPLPGTWVSVGYGAYPKNQTYTDEHGRFELGPLYPGTQELWLWRVGYAQLRHDVDVSEGVARRDGVEIVLGAPHFLAGTVVDASGAPAPSVLVYIDDPEETERVEGFSMYTDRDGRFRFDGLPDVPLQVGTLEDGYTRNEHDVGAIDRDDVVVRLQRGAGLAGRVVEDVGGAPVGSFTLRIVQALDRVATSPDSIRSFDTPDGVWRLADDLEAGKTFMIEIRSPGFAPGYAQVTSAFDPDPDACLVRLARGARVRGRVVERETQRPIAGARVLRRSWTHDGGDRTPVETRTDADGRFELADQAPGELLLRVEAEAEGLGAVDGPIEVVGQETIERWIEVGGRGRIAGRLLDPLGGGIAAGTVRLFARVASGSTTDRVATTAADGAFEFRDLPAGLYQLYWERKLGAATVGDLMRIVSLPGGGDLRCDLRPRGRATLSGTVTTAHGALPGVVPVYLGPAQRTTLQPDGQRGALAVDGRFEVPGIEPGSWSVNAYTTLADGSTLFGHVVLEIPPEGVVEAALVLAPRP